MTQLKIMVVDDQSIHRKQAEREFLNRAGDRAIEVLQARDGLEGIELFERHADITHMLVDVHMPGMDGPEMLRQLFARHRERLSQVTIFIVTTETNRELVRESRDWGVSAWLIKPVQFSKLCEHVLASEAG